MNATAPITYNGFTQTVAIVIPTATVLKGVAGSTLAAATEGTDYLSGASNKLPRAFSFGGSGSPTVATDVTAWLYVDYAQTVTRITMTCKSAPSGNFQVAVKRSADSGATFPDVVATITVGSGSKFATSTTIATPSLAAGDLLRCDVLSVNAAADWTARLTSLSRNQ